MRKLLLIVLFMIPGLTFADQHVLFGRDWVKMTAEQKAFTLEGLVMGLFMSQEVVKNELTMASIKDRGIVGDYSDIVYKINTAVVDQLSRISSQQALIELLDRWAKDHPGDDIPEALSALIMNAKWELLLYAGGGRWPSDGYNDITRKALGYVNSRK